MVRRGHLFCSAVALLFGLTACENAEEAYDGGYGDGYAVGYNTACEIRATLVANDWNSANYSRGYADGQTDGIIACNADKRAGTVQ